MKDVRVLAIGDLANNSAKLKKYLKRSKIHLINFPWNTPSIVMDEKDDVEFFTSSYIPAQLKKINEVKDKYDICLAISPAGARLAYLADLNYVIYFVGHDIRTPPFIKNVKDPFAFDKPVYSFNFFERRFYKSVYDMATACVTTGHEAYSNLLKYRKDGIRIDHSIVDLSIFNSTIKPAERIKEKFTFFSPQRIGLFKGYDIILKALPLCKTEFEILQVNWFDKRNVDEEKFCNEFLDKIPQQIKLIPVMKRDDVAKYYMFADAILGQMKVGNMGGIELEAGVMKKPVLCYYDPKMTYLIDGKEITAPFLPNSRDPKELAQLIDKIVLSEEFREDLAEKEHHFTKMLTDPEKTAAEWDNLFEKIFIKYKNINRNSPTIIKKLRIYYFLITNRLYIKKFKKIFKIKL